MDDETLSTTFFPSMRPKEPERIIRTEQGEAMIPFKMDDEAAALSRLADEQEEQARQQHQQEIENIRRHGPLNRLTERIKGDLEELGATDDDIAMVDYFKDIVDRTDDPAWKRWAVEMALWSRKAA